MFSARVNDDLFDSGASCHADPACAASLSPHGAWLLGLGATDMHVVPDERTIRWRYSSQDINMGLTVESILGGTRGPHDVTAARRLHVGSWSRHHVRTVLKDAPGLVPALHFMMELDVRSDSLASRAAHLLSAGNKTVNANSTNADRIRWGA